MADSTATRTIDAFAVFGPRDQLLTARLKRGDAEDAASIIGGSAWESSGYTVEPVVITRFIRSGT